MVVSDRYDRMGGIERPKEYKQSRVMLNRRWTKDEYVR